jgi:hypothetical protein
LGKKPQIPLKAPIIAPANRALMGLSISTPMGGILEIINRLIAKTIMLIKKLSIGVSPHTGE